MLSFCWLYVLKEFHCLIVKSQTSIFNLSCLLWYPWNSFFVFGALNFLFVLLVGLWKNLIFDLIESNNYTRLLVLFVEFYFFCWLTFRRNKIESLFICSLADWLLLNIIGFILIFLYWDLCIFLWLYLENKIFNTSSSIKSISSLAAISLLSDTTTIAFYLFLNSCDAFLLNVEKGSWNGFLLLILNSNDFCNDEYFIILLIL